jgi:O-phospho-L-seryl-tRNASec:L-selenocysteinyl-tRNA synthase
MLSCETEASRLIKSTYVKQGLQSLQQRKKVLQNLLIHKKLPPVGLDDAVIEFILSEFASMDSNNFSSNAGVGEREGRVFSSLVARRHFNFSHGIGRSGDIAEVQPKAAGSSIMYKLTRELVGHALLLSGFSPALIKDVPLVLPLATGMSLGMCLIALKNQHPEAEYVIWPRIDQKSCFKSIQMAGLKPLVVENELSPEDGSMRTDTSAIKALMELHGNRVLCVLSTTSCFAPRQPDVIDEIAKLCKEFNVGHVINNAYGVQCPIIIKLINRAVAVGRVDAIVQSTDKNFMVPVGGAIVTSPASTGFLKELSALYPGRASAAPIMDIFVTLLSMGEEGYKGLLDTRLKLLESFKARLADFATSHGEVVLTSPSNSISIGISLKTLDALQEEQVETKVNKVTFFGSMLFQRNISGCRVVSKSTKVTTINNCAFIGWGSHSNVFPTSYFTAACSIGLTAGEIDTFLERLEKSFAKAIGSHLA